MSAFSLSLFMFGDVSDLGRIAAEAGGGGEFYHLIISSH